MPPQEIFIPVARRLYTTRALLETGLANAKAASGYANHWGFVDSDEAFGTILSDNTFRYISSHSLLRPGGGFNQVLRTDANDNLGVNVAPNENWHGDYDVIEFHRGSGVYESAVVGANGSIFLTQNLIYVINDNQWEHGANGVSNAIFITASSCSLFAFATGAAGALADITAATTNVLSVSSVSNVGFQINANLGDFDFNVWSTAGIGFFVEGNTSNSGMGTITPFVNIAGAWSPAGITGLHLYSAAAKYLTIEGADVYQQWVGNDAGANEKILELRNTGGGSAEFRSLNDNGSQRLGELLTMGFADGNIGIGVPAFQAACVRNLGIVEGTAPGGATADQIYIWAQDDAGTAEAYVQDGAGNQLKFSPHSKIGEWEFNCKNIKTGRVLNIQMEQLVKFLDKKFGTNFLTETKSL